MKEGLLYMDTYRKSLPEPHTLVPRTPQPHTNSTSTRHRLSNLNLRLKLLLALITLIKGHCFKISDLILFVVILYFKLPFALACLDISIIY